MTAPQYESLEDVQSLLLGQYTIERELGQGGMATVYLAEEVKHRRPVAIKVLRPEIGPALGAERFLREIGIAARLSHPHLVPLIDSGQAGGLLYYVSAYLPGGSLRDRITGEGRLAVVEALRIVEEVGAGLDFAHRAGFVHRDVKPENILVLADKNDDGAKIDVVKLCDFGIAKVARQMLAQSRSFAPRLTEEGVVMGTPEYMSPEQAQGHAVDGRSDIYAVGVVLYHLLAGQTPFTADSAVGIALQHVSEMPIPPSHHRNVQPGLEAVCLRALSKRPEDRFQTAREMRKALRDALTVNSTAMVLTSVPPTTLEVGSTFSTSRPAVLSLREEIARHRSRGNRRHLKRLTMAYAAVASVTIMVSAFVASRDKTVDPIEHIERAYRFPAPDPGAGHIHAGMAMLSGSEGAEGPSPSVPARNDAEPIVLEATPATGEATDGRLSKIVAPSMESTRRVVTRGRQQPAAKPAQRSVVALSPPSSPIPASESVDALLIRSEPWPGPPDMPEHPASLVAAPAPTERREATQPRPSNVSEAPPVAQNVQTPSSRSAAAPSRPLDIGRASVALSNIVTSAGISGARVKASLSHVPLLVCYQQALQSRSAESALDTQLRISVDVGGRVVGATLSKDGDLPGLRGCVEAAARGARIQGVDTGDGSATIQLRFMPR
jgi:serine/threonine protein kinase